MVRIISREATDSVAFDASTSFSGPGEFVWESFWDGSVAVDSGEWLVVSGVPVQTLPMIREYYYASWILIPFALVAGFQGIMRALKR